MIRWLAAAAALLLLAGGGAAAWVLRELAPPDPGADASQPELFEVPRGAGFNQISRRLEERGLVRNALVLRGLARFRGVAGRLQAGEYELSPAWPARAVLARLTTGRVKTYKVSIPEGLRATQIADRLAAAGLADREAFLAVVADTAWVQEQGLEGDSLEGYLYPETYRLARSLPPHQVALAFVEQFRKAWAQVAERAAERDMSMAFVVTLASIVEKETAAPEERPLIAAVFLNRLEQGMRLETDPTVIYGITDFDGNLTRSHLRDESNPYNTYRIRGLPPGPIANPGIEALRAVVEPAESDYLYFVSRNDGTHVFSVSYADHVNAVNHWQKNRANRNRSRSP